MEFIKLKKKDLKGKYNYTVDPKKIYTGMDFGNGDDRTVFTYFDIKNLMDRKLSLWDKFMLWLQPTYVSIDVDGVVWFKKYKGVMYILDMKVNGENT